MKELIPQDKVTHQEDPKDADENRQKEKRYNLHRQQHYPYFGFRSPQLFEQNQISFSLSLYFKNVSSQDILLIIFLFLRT